MKVNLPTLQTFNITPTSSSTPSLTSSPTSDHTEPLLPRSSQRPLCTQNKGRKRKRTVGLIILLGLGLFVGFAVKAWRDEGVEVESAREKWKEWGEWAREKGEGVKEMGSGEKGMQEVEGKLDEVIVHGSSVESEMGEVKVGEMNLDLSVEKSKWVEIGGEEDEQILPIEEVLLDDEREVVEEILIEEEAGEVGIEEKKTVRPFARLPSNDPNVKYLSFENHSGFHNQRKSLVNALTLSRLLNRTLLLPPARLGNAIPWGPEPDLIDKLVFSEECKNGFHPELAVATSTNSHLVAEQKVCDDSNKWTYVDWTWLIKAELFEGRSLVDRWNSSRSWFETSVDDGGLGLNAKEDIHSFLDDDRRSYQIYDSKETPTQLDFFKTRIQLDDLLKGPISEKRLLQFGSLFSGGRMVLSKEENKKEYDKTFNGVILENQGLDSISNEVRDRLGSYVAIHARTGAQERSSIFYKKANSNMIGIFRKLTHSVLGIKAREVDRMVEETKARLSKQPRKRFSESEEDSLGWSDDFEEATPASASSQIHSATRFHHVHRSINFLTSTLTRRALSGSPSKPLSPLLHCRKPLHPSSDPILSPLNTPLYIATDSRSPTTDESLQIFFDWFPCIFTLDDVPVPGLERLVRGGVEEWIGDYDGQELSKYLFPFLESEIAARAVEVVGTPQSTFSGYTQGILHNYYASQDLLAPWN